MNVIRILVSVVLLAVMIATVFGGGGCIFGGDETTTTLATVPTGETTASSASSTPTASTIPVVLDPLSTFESKDPFRQQALPPSTAGSTTTTTGGNGSTTTTTGGNGSTTTTQPSGVTTPVHSLKVLSIDVANGVPVVTFEVDGVVYEDKKEGDVVSTSWGQIEVVSIDPEQQVVVLLHGSETRTLAVGQEFLK
jgi:hypothetical protein